jgi:uncharacterized protein YjbJ (UPF0337 family)
MRLEARSTKCELTNNPDLEADGIVEKIAGKIQNKIGRVATVVEKA